MALVSISSVDKEHIESVNRICRLRGANVRG